MKQPLVMIVHAVGHEHLEIIVMIIYKWQHQEIK